MMLRNILAAIAGYIAMAAVLFAPLSLLWLAVGPSCSFQPRSWVVSGSWALCSIVHGLAAACFGGRVCARMAHDASTATILTPWWELGVVRALMSVESGGTAP